jgi:hypothetical protein
MALSCCQQLSLVAGCPGAVAMAVWVLLQQAGCHQLHQTTAASMNL